MNTALSIVTDSTGEPLTTAQVRDHVRGSTEDNTIIARQAEAARTWCENHTRRVCMLKKLRYSLDFWPRSEIELPRPVNASSTAKPLTVSYRAQGASTYTTFASTNYLVDTESEPGRIVLKYGVSWPSGSLEAGQSVRVDFWSGSTAVSVVPPAFLQGILLASEDWYENRGNVVVGTISSEIAMGLKSVLAELRIPAVP